MIIFDKKRALLQILGPEQRELQGGQNPLDIIADELLNAVKNGDKTSLLDSLRAVHTEFSGPKEGE